ncbi:MAG: glycosyl hydrolase [Saprospiraceae bacterium]|nr:glycosyl hydrolase [Saprospiraceae bacterium]
MKPQFALIVLLGLLVNKSYTQIKINAATFGSLEARAMGPATMSGRITDIKGVDSSPKILYIGTAGGGVWKSTNAGASYKPVFDKYCQSIGAIAIDQKNPDTLYVGTGESNMRNSVSIGTGLYKSTDAGDNWVKIGLDSTEHISKIVIDPKNSSNIYVAAPGPLWSDSQHRGLFKSTDGGKSWQKIFYINERTGCADIAIHPENPAIVYATFWEFRRKAYSFASGGKSSGIYKSENGGQTWRKLTNGLPDGDFGRVALTLAPSEPDKLLAIVESNNTGLYISTDGGEHWKSQSATMNVVSRPFYFSTLVVDPFDAKRVYRPALQFSYSDDGGYSWNDASYDGGWVHSDHHALWINPKNTDHMFLGTDGGVYISNDRGVTWIFCGNLPVSQFYRVAVDDHEPYRIYGGLQDNGSWIGPSEAPGGVSNSDWKMLYWGDGFWTIPDPLDPNTAYAESQGGNAARIDLSTFKSYNIKPQQTKAQDKLRWNWNTPITSGVSNKKNLYIGAQYLFKSTDQGRNWMAISPDLTTNDKKKQDQENSGGLSADNTSAENHCTIYSIAESPFDEKILWVGTDDGNVQLSKDGGLSWQKLNSNFQIQGVPDQAWVSWIELSNHHTGTAYICLDHHTYGDHQTYLLQTTDMGKTWSRIQSPEFTGFAHRIKEDPVNENLLFLGTEMGLFASLDKGTNWFRMKNKIPEYALVRDIQIQERNSSLIVGTHGRGIYIIDDITAMRKMTSEFANRKMALIDCDTMVLSSGKYGGGMDLGNFWNAPNPDDIPPFKYYLKERIMKGEFKAEILDMEGKTVQSLTPSNRKGINKIYWNQRMKPGKVAEGGTKLDFSAFVAPKVLPGKYQLRLSIGHEQLIDTFELIHKDLRDYTLADRIAQHELCMQYYKMHEQLAGIVAEIQTKQEQLNSLIKKCKKQKHRTWLETYHSELETLRSDLLATKQKSIFADEEKLRERISDAYSAAAIQDMRPSNLVTDRAQQLKSEVEEAGRNKDMMIKKNTAGLDKIIKAEKLYEERKP